MEMTAQCSLVIKIGNRTLWKYKTSLCHSNPIIYSTLSAITQDIGYVETAKKRAKEMVEKIFSNKEW